MKKLQCLIYTFLFPIASYSHPSNVQNWREINSQHYLRDSTDSNSKFLHHQIENFSNEKNLKKNVQRIWISYLDFIEENYGIKLSLHESLDLVKEHLNSFSISPKLQSVLKQVVNDIQFQTPSTSNLTTKTRQYPACINEPIKLQPNPTINTQSHTNSPLIVADTNNAGYPDDVYIGAIELFGGALTLILGLVDTSAIGIATIMLGDGIRRVLDGVKEISNDADDDFSYKIDYLDTQNVFNNN